MNLFIAALLNFYMMLPTDGPACHDFHVSKLDIRYNPAAKSCELTLHLFIDDLEEAMKAAGIPVHSLQTNDNEEKSKNSISRYLTSKIRIKADGKVLPLQYLGREEAERFDAVFIYLEAENVGVPGQLSVENRLFQEIFDDQKNIVSVTFDKKLTAFEILDKKNPSLDVNF